MHIAEWSNGTVRDRTVTRTVTLLAGLAALVIALAPPMSAFLAARDRMDGALETSARLHAAEVGILAPQTPGFWSFDGLRIWAPTPADPTAVPERRRVYDLQGHLVVESVPREALDWPILSHQATIEIGGKPIGVAEASRSFRRALIMTSLVGLVSGLGGALIFIALRVVPLRRLKQALDRAGFLASHDVLTGLPNRAVFSDRLRQGLVQAERYGSPTALLCLDLDHFKEVNDTLGHVAGDELLCVVAERMKNCLREGDTLARLGGDEFAVIQPNVKRQEDIEALARRLVETIELPIYLGDNQAQVGVSIGIAISEPGIDQLHLFQNADVALYQAKDHGRGQWLFFTPAMNTGLMERRAFEADLRVAVADQQFYLHYQPQIRLGDGRIVGMEALLRWNRPGHGPVAPGQVIALAEEVGLIGAIGGSVLREACRFAVTLPDHLCMAVNVSPAQFRLPNFRSTVIAALETSGLAPSRLELEITESMLLLDSEETLQSLNSLREVGVRIAMDDFGVGYSSLGYLLRFRFDRIKIDRSFIQRMVDDPSAAAIVRAVVAISDVTGMSVIAEGVETAEQAELLSAEGCPEAQGYLYGRPMPASALAKLLVSEFLAG